MYTNKGQIVEMEGPIHIDIFQQNRLLVNGVGLALKLWPLVLDNGISFMVVS
jgi:hypothetical protein